jgi:hypothetical protein
MRSLFSPAGMSLPPCVFLQRGYLQQSFHLARNTEMSLKEFFPIDCIGRGGRITWPAPSPDFIPMDINLRTFLIRFIVMKSERVTKVCCWSKNISVLIPVAARSEAYVCGRSLSGIESRPGRGCHLWLVYSQKSLRRADPPSRGVRLIECQQAQPWPLTPSVIRYKRSDKERKRRN